VSLLAISTGLTILAIIGLVIGLVVLGVVIMLFSAVLSPTRQIARHAREAPDVAPFLTNGVQGVEELRRTRDLCSQVPPLALAYLAKMRRGGPAVETPEASSPSPAPARGGLEGLISGGKP